MRDAVTLEALGIPTAILVNDVFEPIAHATSALLELPPDYVSRNVVWLPHPTSNLTASAAETLIDERIEMIRKALLGSNGKPANGVANQRDAGDPLEVARAVVEGLAASLRADGADLVLLRYEDGAIDGEVRIGDLTCEDGSCIMPADALAKMVEAMVKPKVPSLRSVTLRDVGR